MDWMNAVIQGVLLGGLYALFAAGLSLVFGIMRVVNLAHGDFIILAALLSVVVVGVTGLGPFLSLVIVVPLMGGLGYAVQRGLLARTLDRRPCRGVRRGPDAVLSGHRSGPPPRRVRDGRHRWSRIAVGNADGRRHSRDCAHDRCQARSRLPRADRASRVPAGAARAAAGAVREASERDVTAAGYTIERGTTASRLGARAGAVLVAALVALPFWGSSGDMRLMVEFLSMLTLAQMWNLLAGYGGLVSVGQQAYVGLGGYALIVLADILDVNPFVSVFLAGVVTAAFALPTAAVVFRILGGYLALRTWLVAEGYRRLVAHSP